MKRSARTALGAAFMLSVALHAALLLTLRAPSEPQPDETLPIAFESARPMPTPKPTPRPKPTPHPTPRPSSTPRRISHAPPRRRSVHVAHQRSHSRGTASTEHAAEGNQTAAGSDGGATTGDPGASPTMPAGEQSPQPTPEPTPVPTPPPACAQPNVAAATLEPVAPETPPLAAQQGITGDVTVEVALDEQSRVTAVRVVTSPSALLNDAALRAARASTFRTEIRDCRPVAADYAFIVEFSAQ